MMREKVFEQVAELVLKVQSGEMSAEELNQFLRDFYDSNVNKYLFLLDSVDLLLKKATTDFQPLITTIIELMNVVREDPKFQQALLKNAELRAKLRIQILKIYIKAGFTRQEAMTLLLQDVANLHGFRQELFTKSDRRAAKHKSE